ncbi:Hypothetical protein R9X50_00270400 [Acrodontium crateriforme]|uniref:Cyclin-domain-containing protein n=1 Tax=Acrodontium crateriforme TaxID=150365 RepID=A0AAQ3M2Z7_9PEZI|nr:Hypothetical protein R9X50_00270400 [Acrodontium crateriforme]
MIINNDLPTATPAAHDNPPFPPTPCSSSLPSSGQPNIFAAAFGSQLDPTPRPWAVDSCLSAPPRPPSPNNRGMEDGSQHTDAGAADPRSHDIPPPPPEPSTDANVTAASLDPAFSLRSDDPLILDSEQWDITSISALGALRMLIEALQTLADAMGDVPPTPPASRPGTPRRGSVVDLKPRVPSPEASGSMAIGSPEAHPHEPITIDVGAHAEDVELQRIAIARRFFSKVAPPFSISEYLLRIHHWCPHSPGVYLAAASYCHRLCVVDLMVPATNRTIHRLALGSIRVASKALEDNKWTQDRISKVGGVGRTQLMNLEVTLCFLLDFELGVTAESLARRMYLLQQAARQGLGTRRLSQDFRLRIPFKKRSMRMT